jgi:hypothetical protein
MRLIPRHRQHRRPKGPRIAISEAEISADLHYPAQPQRLPRRGADDLQRSGLR